MFDQKAVWTLLDLTSLNETDDALKIKQLCEQAVSISAAAVCVYPQWVPVAVDFLKASAVKVATVANFPEGIMAWQTVEASIKSSIAQGAAEIDVVFPYPSYCAGEKAEAIDFVRKCRKVCEKVILKVILETGVLAEENLILAASRAVLTEGADFIKTSTGKKGVGATLLAANLMLQAIKEVNPKAGFKASGGIRGYKQALEYVELAEKIMGKAWVTPQHFRIGTSRVD